MKRIKTEQLKVGIIVWDLPPEDFGACEMEIISIDIEIDEIKVKHMTKKRPYLGDIFTYSKSHDWYLPSKVKTKKLPFTIRNDQEIRERINCLEEDQLRISKYWDEDNWETLQKRIKDLKWVLGEE